jgi:hypothetical protein
MMMMMMEARASKSTRIPFQAAGRPAEIHTADLGVGAPATRRDAPAGPQPVSAPLNAAASQSARQSEAAPAPNASTKVFISFALLAGGLRQAATPPGAPIHLDAIRERAATSRPSGSLPPGARPSRQPTQSIDIEPVYGRALAGRTHLTRT